MKIDKFIGIDPGLTGAVSVFSNTGKLIDVYEFIKDGSTSLFNYSNYLNFLEKHFKNNIFITIEKQQPFAKIGIKSIFTLGGVYYLQILPFLEKQKEIISPKTWQKYFALRNKHTKEDSVKKAIELFGNCSYFFGPRGGKKHNVTDACLIGYYGYLDATNSIE